MWVLAIDTATAATAVAMVTVVPDRDPVTRSRRQRVDPRGHGEWLAPQIEAVLAEAGTRPAELAAIVAGTGPGPFTGLRVGLATAAAMGQALDIPTYGVCSLDGIGAGLTVPEPVLVATDARRREIYWAIYRGGERLTDPAVGHPAEILPAIARHRVRRGYGEGVLRYQGAFGLPVGQDPPYPDPAVLVSLAYERIVTGKPGELLTPRYLRRPDAAQPGMPKPALPR